ncbi:cytochrome P450 [Dacryopinax primogenitus]|uniref:Cytochrome P450 n=1 Tax=Dacryopinax primogenitus (strain DJM 731) TaxID=1858805 RepID=M5FZE6_DACPD|nr:cytochrome P450 [Dacryopinax primogenitus]EJT98941.1 cytochrome P450 [Dacryopinax primogenitus]
MFLVSLVLGAGTIAVFLLISYNSIHRVLSSPPVPPGPPGLPVLGNLFQLPKANSHLIFAEWSRRYGDMMTLTVLGKPIIVLNSARAVTEVLEKGASASAGRPQLVMAHELVGLGKLPTLTSDVSMHRKYRRLYARALNSTACQNYWDIQLREMRRGVLQLLEGREDPVEAIMQSVGSIISEVVYGHRLTGPDDEFLVTARKVLLIFERVIRPGAFIVDTLPFLKHLPDWFPGASFKITARQWRETADELRQTHLQKVQREMEAGTAQPCYVSNILSRPQILEHVGFDELVELVKYSAGTLYGAGADTTLATLENFLVAMLLFPKVWERGREEIERVIGQERLPKMQDRAMLPYCQAMVQEILRWRPVVPLGIPHAMLEDGLYSGYRFPRGTTVIASIWSMTHNSKIYPHPEEFRPERFLSDDGTRVLDGGREAFGFGRRVCPGQHLAEASVFAFIITFLWGANMTGSSSFDGTVIYETGAVNRPKEIPCQIQVRSEQCLDMLQASLSN